MSEEVDTKAAMVVSALAAWQPSLSATGQAGQAMPGQGYGELLMMSLGLVAVIGVLAVVAVKVLGRGRMGGRRGDLLEVIARQPLEPRRSLYVVRAGRRRLLVGTSELGVTMLTELEGVDEDAEEMAGRGGGRESLGFADLVREATRRWSGRKVGKGTKAMETMGEPPGAEGNGAGDAGGRRAGEGGPPELGPS